MALCIGALLAKADIKSAFRPIPVHSADRYFLGMLWKDDLFIDMYLSTLWTWVGSEVVQHIG